MPLYAVCFLAVLALPLLVVVALSALVYFVVCRLCDLTESFIETLPWLPKGRKKRVNKGFGLSTLRNVFTNLQHGNNAKNQSKSPQENGGPLGT